MRKKILENIYEKLERKGKLLFLTRTGSYLYGTNTSESDKDFVGVFIANKKYKLGFNKIDEIDCSIKDKDITGKNTKYAIDIKIFELEKFLKLAMNCNPNIIELIFANEENILFNTKEFKIFQKNYNWFVNKRAITTFNGYAKQQFKKGIIKAENLKEINEVISILEKYNKKELIAVIAEKEENIKKRINNKNLTVGNLNFQTNLFVKNVLKKLKEKVKITSHREKLWKEFGYDTKFFMHLFRLLNEGEQLIKERKITFPVKERPFLLNVRLGKYDLDFLKEEAKKRFENFKNLKNNLPDSPNKEKIEENMINIYINYFNQNY